MLHRLDLADFAFFEIVAKYNCNHVLSTELEIICLSYDQFIGVILTRCCTFHPFIEINTVSALAYPSTGTPNMSYCALLLYRLTLHTTHYSLFGIYSPSLHT